MTVWIEDRDPYSPGFYGTLIRPDRRDPFSFFVGYWDGEGWKIPSQAGILAAYRQRPVWCKIELGADSKDS